MCAARPQAASPSPTSLIVRNDVPKAIALELNVRTFSATAPRSPSAPRLRERERSAGSPALPRLRAFPFRAFRLTIRHLQLGERHELALVQHHRLRPAQKPPPLPGATGDDQRDQQKKSRGHERVDSPDKRLARVVNIAPEQSRRFRPPSSGNQASDQAKRSSGNRLRT